MDPGHVGPGYESFRVFRAFRGFLTVGFPDSIFPLSRL